MIFNILVTARSFANTPGEHHEYLRQHGCQLDLRAPSHPYSADQLAEIIPGHDGVILGLDACDASVIARADKLLVISRYGVGVDAVDLEAAAHHGVAVTNTPGANTIAVAELTIGLLFSLARQIPLVAGAARQNIWKRPTGWEITGKTLGIIGYGSIGREVARRALGLGMTVLVHDPFWKGEASPVESVDLEMLLARADVVTLHSALSPETTNLINADRIACMKNGAYLINTARGELVDEDALLSALTSGKLGGAAADAFRQEPPEGSPLLALDNFIAMPHLGATTRESVHRMSMMAAHNLVAVLNGEPCEYVVNRALLQRSFRSDR
jgi:D-3-phosphoglycerate dehydrogenase